MEYKVVVSDQGTFWYKINSNILHREGGPAITYCNGAKFWYQNDKLYRIDGPAVEGADGSKYWYLFDKNVSEQDVKNYVAKKNPPTVCDKVIDIDGQKYKLIAVESEVPEQDKLVKDFSFNRSFPSDNG